MSREEAQGLYLTDGTAEEVLLPWNSQQGKPAIGDTIEVFLYRDSEDRRIATQEKPFAVEGEFAALQVVDSGKAGTFMQWGLLKDLIVPRSEQRNPMQLGETHVVRVCLDPRTDRLFGSAQLDFFLEEAPADLPLNEPCEVLVYERAELGWLCIVKGQYAGMLYHNQVFQHIQIGQQLTAFPQKVREDGKLDLLLRKAGYHGQVENDAATILFFLENNGGVMPYNDKSSPEEITEAFRMSKKQFKKALGYLYKQGKIVLKTTGTELVIKK